MKKKKLARLKQQFQPSHVQTRGVFFHLIEKQAQEFFDLPITISALASHPEQMDILRTDLTTEDALIHVPLDENFEHVIERIRKGEKGLAERFSFNLAEEIAQYWQKPLKPEQDIPVDNKKGLSLGSLQQAIAAYPDFYLKEGSETIELHEKNPKGDRLLAVISTVEENDFTIESALNRKYKLKLQLIPLIEKFAATPISGRS